MSRWNLLIILIVCPIMWSGCSMCCGPYDYEYPIMDNARYPRLDPEYGRVGSIFSDPNAVIGPVPKTNADLPVEEDTREEIKDLDDPDFDLNTDPFPDPNADPFRSKDADGNDIDTSANGWDQIPSQRGWR